MTDISLIFQGVEGWGVYRNYIGGPDLSNFPNYYYRIYIVKEEDSKKAFEYLLEVQTKNRTEGERPQREKGNRPKLFPDLPFEFKERTRPYEEDQ